jgi:tetratricopeptide (TPR) repeat protein
MSKPMAVTLPIVLIIMDIYPLERATIKTIFTERKKVLIEKIPFFVLCLFTSVLTVMAQRASGAIQTLDTYPLVERFLVGIRAIFFYIIKMIWPVNLAPLYPYPSPVSLFTPEFYGPLILVFIVTVFCIWLWKRQKIFSVVWAYYVASLFPVLGFVQVGGQAAADRYTYLPSLGPFLLAGLVIVSMYERVFKKNGSRPLRSMIAVVSMLVLVFILSATIKQISMWENSLILWNEEVKNYDYYYRAYYNRGMAYSDRRKYSQAIVDFDKAIELNPSFVKAYINRAISYVEMGNDQKGIENFETAIKINHNDADIYYNRGIIFEDQGKYHQALKDFNMTITLDPHNFNAYNLRGDLHVKMGRYQDAVRDFSKVIELSPYIPNSYYNRGVAHEGLKNYQLAIKDYSKAISLNPEYASAFNNRGIIYAISGNYLRAMQDFNSAIKLNSEDSAAYFNRGLAYKMLGKNEEASRDFKKAANLGYKKAQQYITP